MNPNEPMGTEARADLLFAALRSAPSVADQPVVALMQWRVVQLPNRERVLVGCIEGSMTLRITSPIVKTDQRRLWTMSGRCYEMRYQHATTAEMLELVRLRLAASGHMYFLDVTEEVLSALCG